jgi:hypothetical protein
MTAMRKVRSSDGAQDSRSALAEDTEQVFVISENSADDFVESCDRLLSDGPQVPEGVTKNLASLWPPRTICPRSLLEPWLNACVRDAKALHPGSTKEALLENFHVDGGISDMVEVRFVHNRCWMLKVLVSFAGGAGKIDDWEDPDARVETVCTYIGIPLFD